MSLLLFSLVAESQHLRLRDLFGLLVVSPQVYLLGGPRKIELA